MVPVPSYSSLESKSATLSSGILSLPGTIGPSTSGITPLAVGPSVVPVCVSVSDSTVDPASTSTLDAASEWSVVQLSSIEYVNG